MSLTVGLGSSIWKIGLWGHGAMGLWSDVWTLGVWTIQWRRGTTAFRARRAGVDIRLVRNLGCSEWEANCGVAGPHGASSLPTLNDGLTAASAFSRETREYQISADYVPALEPVGAWSSEPQITPQTKANLLGSRPKTFLPTLWGCGATTIFGGDTRHTQQRTRVF
jgi:hypothetical protein